MTTDNETNVSIDETNTDETKTDDTKVDDTNTDDTSKETTTEDIISGIEGILNKDETEVSEQEKKEPDKSVDEKVEEDESSGYEEVSSAIAIPFVEAAKAAGWNESDIRSYIGVHTDEQLVGMTSAFGSRSAATKKEVSKDDKKSDELELDEALLEQLGLGDEGKGALKKLLTPIMSQLNAKDKELKSFKDKFQNIENSEKTNVGVQRLQAADDMFDAAAEELPSLGKTKDLPKLPNGDLVLDNPQVKNREKVFNLAYTLAESGKYSFRDAMKIALDSHKGSTAEKEFKDKIIKNLKKGETRLSAKGQQTQAAKKYKDARSEGVDIVKQAFRKSGVEVPT